MPPLSLLRAPGAPALCRLAIGPLLVLLGLVAPVLGPAAARGAEKRILSLAEARVAVAAAVARARQLGAPGGAIAVVDDGGHLVSLERLDGTFPAAASVSTAKARTAATFRKATGDFEDAIRNGRTSLVAVSELTPLQGGVPILVDGQVVGAVGVSGAASAQQDEDIAKAAAAARVASLEVAEIGAEEVRAAFAKGAPLLETGAWKIHASRREAPGQAEVHVRDSDLIYVLEGAATLVTGGELVDGREVAPDEIRGSSIAGGAAREIGKGEVVVVPYGTPHWFQEVRGPVLYYVVKVTEGGAAR